MFNWLKPKKPSEVKGASSAGGSKIIHHPKEPPKPQLGFADQSVIEDRERIYQEFFGECESVFHELIPVVPHVDIYKYKPGHAGRDFYTLVSGGMSDMPMTMDEGVGREFSRAEVVLYVEEPTETHFKLLQFIAHFPHDYKTWLCTGHTIPNGQPPASLLKDSELTTVLLLPPVLDPDAQLGERLACGGEPVNLLWAVPITDAECRLKLEHGLDALLDLFDKNQHPLILDPRRRSYV